MNLSASLFGGCSTNYLQGRRHTSEQSHCKDFRTALLFRPSPKTNCCCYGRLRGWFMNVARMLSLFALLGCCSIPGSLSAQELKCDSVRPLLGSSSAYKNRGNRCEGLYVADVGSRSIDIVSFTSGSIRYDLNTKSPLKLSVVGTSPLVNVRAVAITPKTYYRMDTF